VVQGGDGALGRSSLAGNRLLAAIESPEGPKEKGGNPQGHHCESTRKKPRAEKAVASHNKQKTQLSAGAPDYSLYASYCQRDSRSQLHFAEPCGASELRNVVAGQTKLHLAHLKRGY
jgi:hypothetical protein